MSTPHKAITPYQPASQVGKVFVEKYDLLLQWALRLTHGDREEAEDLLHEAFVQFALRQMDFAGIENIEGYLYTVLKHFHRSSQRRARRDPLNQISLVEFDSVDLALRSTFDFNQVDVQNDLRRICAFLCWRKASAKFASYLILRFFHGYYPEEIARIALTSRNVVDQGIRIASSEAKVCLTDPGRLHFMPRAAKDKQQDQISPGTPEAALNFAPVLFAIPAMDFLRTLREIIFSSRVGECLPEEELLRLYEGPVSAQVSAKEESAATMDRTLLAHLVSCPQCLDAVNRHLRLPPLSDRFPGERLGNDRRNLGRGGRIVRRAPKDTGSQMSNEQALQEMRLAKDSILRIAQMRLRECYEHQPKRLFVAVNGEIVATQDVASDHNKQSVRLHHRKTVDFIEVFSEQGIRLAFISVVSMPPEGPDTLSQKVELSAERSLQAVLEFTSSGPLLEVVYSDPLLARSVDSLEAELDQSLQIIADLKASSDADGPRRKHFFTLLRRRWVEWTEWTDAFRPLVISGAIAMLLAVIAGLFFARSYYKVKEAQTLLAEAAQQESRPIANGHVLHRALEFEVAAENGGQAIQSGTVKVWKSSDNNRLAMRYSTQDGKLLAGVWKAVDGSYSIYRNHKLADHAPTPENLVGNVTPGDSDDLWMHEPSASGFETLAAKQGAVTLQKSGDDSIIDYRPALQAADANQPHLVYATLTLRGDRHVVGQVFWIESDGEVRRYSYREISYEERAGTPADADVFSPDPELLGGHTSLRLHRLSPKAANSVFLAHLNLEAFELMNKVNADSGEQITVKRTPSQRLSISGVLASEERLKQVENALAPLAEDPLVDISMISVDRQGQQTPPAGHHKPSTAPITVESYEINAQTIPAQQRLKAYFSRRGYSGKALDQQIGDFCQQTLGHSSRALQQAWTLHTLASSFSTRDWQHMSLKDRREWIALYLRHSTALEGETQAIRQSLGILLLGASTDPPKDANGGMSNQQPPPLEQLSLNTLSDQLLEQSSVADRVLRSALTASAGPSPDLDALCQQLQASLENTDWAIREIEHRAQDLEASQAVR